MKTEHRITMNLEKLARFVNVALPCLLVACAVRTYFVPTTFFITLSIILFIINFINFYYLYMQKTHTLLANFGLLAQFRYIIESLGPEFRQYLYSSDTEGKPFNRVDREEIYKKSKNIKSSAAFGSLHNFDKTEIKFKHSMFPSTKVEKYSLTFGEERNIKQTYTINKPILIGAMSYGALGSKAIRSLSRGAKKAGIPLNTGEGGHPKYHLMEGSDLIFQMGTAKFGVRTDSGDLDEQKLKSLSQRSQVKMIEIKFSQGAKPGKGGLLPKEKITEEISKLRGVPLNQDVISPPYHSECKDIKSTCLFIKKIQDISSLPVGIKLCLGQTEEFRLLVEKMKEMNIFPDYIAIDGSEGGTGAAPKIFMDHVGQPIFTALPLVHSMLKDLGVRNKLKLLASGKLINSGTQMMALAYGADAIYTARGFMLALGCIQALRCHNNSCPVGITTHSTTLMRGLDIEDKSERIFHYTNNLNGEYYELLSALGQSSFKTINKELLLQQSQNPSITNQSF